MSQDNQELPQSDVFWADEFKHAQPEPSAEFLHRLDQKMAVRAEQLQMENNPMFITRPKFSNNGYQSDRSPIFQVKPRRLPHLRWIAVASILMMILIGGFLSFSTGDDPLPTQSAIQKTDTLESQQVADCTIMPQTGWVVHVVGAESLAEIAQYYALDENDLHEANCFTPDVELAPGNLIYLPLASTAVAIANQSIPASAAITSDMLSFLLWHSANPIPNTFSSDSELMGSYALTEFEAGEIIEQANIANTEVVVNGQVFSANENEVVLNIATSNAWTMPFEADTTLYFNKLGKDCDNIYAQTSSIFAPPTFMNGLALEICLDFTINPSDLLEMPLITSAEYLYQDENQIIVSVPISSASRLNEMVTSDRSFQVLSDSVIYQAGQVAVSMPFSAQEMSNLTGLWSNGVSLQLTVNLQDCATMDSNLAKSINCIDGRPHFLPATVVSVNHIPFHPGEPAGFVVLAVRPQDATFLTWVIQEGLEIEYE